MGDTFTNIRGTIVNRSLVQGSFNKVMAEDSESAEALRNIADFIESSGNKIAAEFFDQFNEELQRPSPRKSLLKASWDNVLAVLPAITSVAGATSAILKLIS